MKQTKWFERKFSLIEDDGLLPSIIERLAGMPARVEEMVKGLSYKSLIFKPENKWSIKEVVGHLSDLEPLWIGRVDDLIDRQNELRAADLSNQKTHNANHNTTDINFLLKRFRHLRSQFVAKIQNLTEEQLLYFSLHPRLKTSMRVIDLAYFVAEHDDHHASHIRNIINQEIK